MWNTIIPVGFTGQERLKTLGCMLMFLIRNDRFKFDLKEMVRENMKKNVNIFEDINR